MKRALRVAVIGAYSHPNFGDQLLFNILNQWILEFRAGTEVVVPWGDPVHIDWPGNVRVGGGWKALLRCDAVVFGGGGFFGEPTRPAPEALADRSHDSKVDRIGLALHLPWFLGGECVGPGRHLRGITMIFLKCAAIARLARLHGMPVCVVGTGVGPVSTRLGRWAVRSVLRRAAPVSVRDEESAAAAREVWPRCSVGVGADMVLSMCLPVSRSDGPLREVGLHLGPGREEQMPVGPYAQAIRRLREAGLRVRLLLDCAPSSGAQLRVPQRIQQELPDLGVVPYRGTAALLATLGSLDMVLTTKLHVGIVAYALGVIPVSVATHVKTPRFYRQVGMLDQVSFDFSPAGLERAVAAACRIACDPAPVLARMSLHRRQARDLALRHRTAIHNFLSTCVQKLS